MPQTIIFESTTFEGSVIFKYDSDNILILFENKAKLNAAQHSFLYKNFPYTMELFKAFSAKLTQEAKISVIHDEITFDKFWEEYGYKADKQDAIKAWNKLTPSQQLKAFLYIPTYKDFVKKQGHAIKMAKTYLNPERDWNA